jgi:tetratricopeptide (TPR) repeat protein
MWNARLRFLAPLTLVLSLALAGRPLAGEQAVKEIYHHTLAATAWVRTSKGSGTGWLVDRARKLLITNYHVVGPDDRVSVIFPAYRDGNVIPERAYYLKQGRTIRGRVIATDPRRDLAAIELESLPEGVKALKLALESAEPSDRVHSVGNPGASAALWVYTSGTVRQVYRQRVKYAGGQEVDARMIETQSPINPGDSGGPVVNDQGELVGVTASHRTDAQLVSYCIDVSEVKAFLARARTLVAPSGTSTKDARAFLDRGRSLAARGEFAKAIDEFSQAIRLDRRDALAYRERGLAYRHAKDYDKAIADYTEAIRLEPKDPVAYNNRAAAWQLLREYGKSIDDCDEAIRLDPKYVTAYMNRGYSYAARGDYDKAVADYTRAIQLNPKDALAYRYRAVAYRNLRDYDKAIADAGEAIRLNPKDAVAHNNRAVALNFKGDPDKAIADATEAIRLDPKYALAYKNRGLFRSAKKEYAQAIADYTEAIRLNPKDAESYVLRGRVYRIKGEEAKAEADFQEAVRLNPALKERER